VEPPEAAVVDHCFWVEAALAIGVTYIDRHLVAGEFGRIKLHTPVDSFTHFAIDALLQIG
jgi:hypothetical protein